MMIECTKRSIGRWIHLAMSIPIVGYIYSPFERIPDYAPAVRFGFLPVMLLSGLWMWKGRVVRGFISKRPPGAHRRGANAPRQEGEFSFAKQEQHS